MNKDELTLLFDYHYWGLKPSARSSEAVNHRAAHNPLSASLP